MTYDWWKYSPYISKIIKMYLSQVPQILSRCLQTTPCEQTGIEQLLYFPSAGLCCDWRLRGCWSYDGASLEDGDTRLAGHWLWSPRHCSRHRTSHWLHLPSSQLEQIDPNRRFIQLQFMNQNESRYQHYFLCKVQTSWVPRCVTQ